jgi:uncharacterized membrane protein YkvA (DUF1232 family)
LKPLEAWKERARDLKREVYALSFACRDPRVPWYAKLLAVGIVGYAFSPIDLIPDFVPVLGYLDDLVLIPLGVMAVRAMIPGAILEECRQRACHLESEPRLDRRRDNRDDLAGSHPGCDLLAGFVVRLVKLRHYSGSGTLASPNPKITQAAWRRSSDA